MGQEVPVVVDLDDDGLEDVALDGDGVEDVALEDDELEDVASEGEDESVVDSSRYVSVIRF